MAPMHELAENDNVPSPMWCGGGMRLTDCRLVLRFSTRTSITLYRSFVGHDEAA